MIPSKAPSLRAAWTVSLVVIAACTGNESPKPGRELRTIEIDAPPAESPERGLLGTSGVSHQALLERLHAIAKAKEVSGLLLQLGEMGGAWARAADLRDALLEIRGAGKQVHCHFETTDNLGYALLARSCDRISMTPAGFLNLVGVSVQAIYAHQLLQLLGLRAEILQVGAFKGAADPLTRDDMPSEVRETMNALLDDLESALQAAIARGRSLPPERVQALIDAGPYTADDAQRAGLVDEVSFADAARSKAKAATKADRVVVEELHPTRESISFWDLLRGLTAKGDAQKPSGKRLTLAYLDGTISRGSAGSYRGSQAETFVKGMRELADDSEVRAVVLRINSPGGSAMASDLMWHAVRSLAKRKPVIVSIGDLCASGGYYVASAGTEIMAQDQSLVGSIGIVGGKIAAEDLAQRVGVHVQRLTRGKRAGWTSPAQSFSPGEREAFEHMLQDGYDRFIARVAEGRRLKAEQIEPVAGGRLMSAQRARQGKLVDREGGLSAAIDEARKRGQLAPDAPLQIWPPRPGLLQALGELSSGGSDARSTLLSSLGVAVHAAVIEALLSTGDPVAAVLPFSLSIE